MDQGDAAVWAAGITGLVGIGGAIAAFAAGKAQARGVVEGTKLQLDGQRDHALWIDQRDAYAAFLASIDGILTTINIAVSAFAAEFEDLVPPHGETYGEAVSRLDGQLKDILGVQSKLKLSIDGPEAEQAELLTIQARSAKSALVTWAWCAEQHRTDAPEKFRFMKDRITDLDDGISSWAENARAQLRKNES
jgi:rhodanese-related sulfurtransferase